MKNKLSKNAEVVKRFLDEKGKHYSLDEESEIFKFTQKVPNKLRDFICHIGICGDEIDFWGSKEIDVDQDDTETLAEMYELFDRIHGFSKNGKIEFNSEESVVECRTFVDCGGSNLSPNVVRNNLFFVYKTFEIFGSGIIDVLNGYTGEEVFEKCTRFLQVNRFESMLEKRADNVNKKYN